MASELMRRGRGDKDGWVGYDSLQVLSSGNRVDSGTMLWFGLA
jgi:hypothetical protein